MADEASKIPEEDVVDKTGPQNLATYSLEQLKIFTNNFNEENSIIKGSNKVFKGALANGTMVAIKRYAISERSQWEAEVEYLPLFHGCDCIVKLLGKAATNKFLYLVYAWVDKGDLDNLISHPTELNWERRQKILRGILRAISELHSRNLIYSDLKAANVLIDEDWNPVLADFGMVGEASKEIRGGTIGRFDDRAWNEPACKETDMYGVGILILQLIMKIRDGNIMGECPFEAIGYTSRKHIIGWAYEFLHRSMSPVHADLNMTPAEADWITCLGLECLALESRPTVDMLLDRLDHCPDHDTVRNRLQKLVEEYFNIPSTIQAGSQNESESVSDSSTKAQKGMGRKWDLVKSCMPCVKRP